MPVSTPVPPFIVATVELLLLQVPPLTSALNDNVPAGHVDAPPLITVGGAAMVTVVVIIQPVESV